MIVACNKIDVKGAYENFERLKKEFGKYMLIPCSAESELALREAAKHKLINYIPGENNFEIIAAVDLVEKKKNSQEHQPISQEIVSYAKFGSRLFGPGQGAVQPVSQGSQDYDGYKGYPADYV